MATICMYRDFKIVSEGLRAAVVVIVLRVYFVGPSNRPSARGRRDARELNAPLKSAGWRLRWFSHFSSARRSKCFPSTPPSFFVFLFSILSIFAVLRTRDRLRRATCAASISRARRATRIVEQCSLLWLSARFRPSMRRLRLSLEALVDCGCNRCC